MDESIEDLEAQQKELEMQRKRIRDKLRLAKSKEKKPMSYYIKNTLFILGILVYLFIMYGPYHLMSKLILLVKPKTTDSDTLQSISEAGGLMILGYILRFTDQRIIRFLKDTICLCFCNKLIYSTFAPARVNACLFNYFQRQKINITFPKE